jgi:hypothetical protein
LMMACARMNSGADATADGKFRRRVASVPVICVGRYWTGRVSRVHVVFMGSSRAEMSMPLSGKVYHDPSDYPKPAQGRSAKPTVIDHSARACSIPLSTFSFIPFDVPYRGRRDICPIASTRPRTPAHFQTDFLAGH